MKESIRFMLKRILLLIAVIVITGIVFSRSLVGLFIRTDSVIAYGAGFLPGFLLALPFMCVDYMTVGVFQAIGEGRKALVFAFLRKIVLEIPLLILLNRLVPLYGLAYSAMCAEIILALVSIKLLKAVLKESVR